MYLDVGARDRAQGAHVVAQGREIELGHVRSDGFQSLLLPGGNGRGDAVQHTPDRPCPVSGALLSRWPLPAYFAADRRAPGEAKPKTDENMFEAARFHANPRSAFPGGTKAVSSGRRLVRAGAGIRLAISTGPQTSGPLEESRDVRPILGGAGQHPGPRPAFRPLRGQYLVRRGALRRDGSGVRRGDRDPGPRKAARREKAGRTSISSCPTATSTTSSACRSSPMRTGRATPFAYRRATRSGRTEPPSRRCAASWALRSFRSVRRSFPPTCPSRDFSAGDVLAPRARRHRPDRPAQPPGRGDRVPSGTWGQQHLLRDRHTEPRSERAGRERPRPRGRCGHRDLRCDVHRRGASPPPRMGTLDLGGGRTAVPARPGSEPTRSSTTRRTVTTTPSTASGRPRRRSSRAPWWPARG